MDVKLGSLDRTCSPRHRCLSRGTVSASTRAMACESRVPRQWHDAEGFRISATLSTVNCAATDVHVVEEADKEVSTCRTGRPRSNAHIEQSDNLVCCRKAEHFWLDLTLDEEPPQRQDGHWARAEVGVASHTNTRGIVPNLLARPLVRQTCLGQQSKGVDNIVWECVELWGKPD